MSVQRTYEVIEQPINFLNHCETKTSGLVGFSCCRYVMENHFCDQISCCETNLCCFTAQCLKIPSDRTKAVLTDFSCSSYKRTDYNYNDQTHVKTASLASAIFCSSIDVKERANQFSILDCSFLCWNLKFCNFTNQLSEPFSFFETFCGCCPTALQERI